MSPPFSTETGHCQVRESSHMCMRSKIFYLHLLTACVRVCVCVCVCVCVFMLFHLLASSTCTTSVRYVRSSDQWSFVVSITRGFCQVPSSLFPNLSYFTSEDVTPACRKTGEKTIQYTAGSVKRWYILIEDIRWPRAKPSSYEKIWKIRRLL